MSESDLPSNRIDRRRFAEQLTLGCLTGAAGLAVAAPSAGAQPVVVVEEPRPRSPSRLLLETVTRLYPNGLQPEHLEPILAEIERQLARSEILASFPLTNSDEPAPSFAAYRAPDAR